VRVSRRREGGVSDADASAFREREENNAGGFSMTLAWLAVWFIFNLIGDKEPLLFDPVNVWTGTLILAIGVDLGRQHTGMAKRR
jgi:hypothetical protein